MLCCDVAHIIRRATSVFELQIPTICFELQLYRDKIITRLQELDNKEI
jgi:hypothetical protein